MDSGEVGSFLETLEQLLRVFQRVATAGELSLPTAAVLARLVREGPLTMTALALAESVSQPNMTQLVNRLERDGLARKRTGRADRRTVLVNVTDKGRRVVQQRRTQRAAVLRELLASSDASDVAAIREAVPALSRLARALGPVGPSPVVIEETTDRIGRGSLTTAVVDQAQDSTRLVDHSRPRRELAPKTLAEVQTSDA